MNATRRLTLNLTLLIWCACAYKLAHAATFTQEVMGWDYGSVFTACVAGLFAGATRTIYVLASEDVAVLRVLRQARRDMVISFMAGGFAYIVMLMVESKFPGTVTPEVRYGGVLVAGWTRTTVFEWFGRLAKAKLDGQMHKYRDGAPPPAEQPASANVPLEKNP